MLSLHYWVPPDDTVFQEKACPTSMVKTQVHLSAIHESNHRPWPSSAITRADKSYQYKKNHCWFNWACIHHSTRATLRNSNSRCFRAFIRTKTTSCWSAYKRFEPLVGRRIWKCNARQSEASPCLPNNQGPATRLPFYKICWSVSVG